MENIGVTVDGKPIEITRADKVLWPEAGITKIQYIQYLMEIAPHLLAYARDRMLMVWRYPAGIGGICIEERSIHGEAPDWLPRTSYNGKERILLNHAAALVWAANREAYEFHVPFDRYFRKDYPTDLAFDLDPADDRDFGMVLEIALKLKDVLDALDLQSVPKTSGATGMQIFVPVEPKYTFEEAREINRFIAEYMLQRMPGKITLDRVVHRRGNKLYFDYLQLWRGRTMAAPYSVRARPLATVSAPVTWAEAARGFLPADFTVESMPGRLRECGDLFLPVSGEGERKNQNLDAILAFIRKHKG